MPVTFKRKPDAETPLTRADAAAYLTANGFPCTYKQLANKAVSGTGPVYSRYGGLNGRALYRPSDLLAWAESRLSEPTALSRRAPADGAGASA